MNGILLVNKARGITSHDVVNQLRRVLKQKRIGHSGTLDPFATGLLVICVGSATKLMPFLINDTKAYEGTICLGTSTITGDLTGEIIQQCQVTLSKDDILTQIHTMIGPSMQTPPAYSAVKVNGKKLYEYARKDIVVDVAARPINVSEWKMIGEPVYQNGNIFFDFYVSVSKGTYIRQLAVDLGNKLGCPSHVTRLNRCSVGAWQLSQANTIEEITNNQYHLYKPLDFLQEYLQIDIPTTLEKKIFNGVTIDRDDIPSEDQRIVFKKNGQLVAIYEKTDRQYRCLRSWVNDND